MEVTGDPGYSGEKIFHISSLPGSQMPSGLKASGPLSYLDEVQITDAVGLTVTQELDKEFTTHLMVVRKESRTTSRDLFTLG